MSDKGETSRKAGGSMRVRDERRESQDTSTRSMKINVMYRGIVYRVRGIKVLCSVITAVILLLVAIVGLGVWMLVSAYGEEKAGIQDGLINNTSLPMPQDLEGRGGNYEDTSTVFSIDFNAPSVTIDELSMAAKVPNIQPQEENLHYNEDNMHFSEEMYFSEEDPQSEEVLFNAAIGHFQGVTPSKEPKSSRMPGPDPPFGLFNGMIDLGDTKVPFTTEFITSTGENNDWASIDSEHIVDSFVELSEHNPVTVDAPSEFYNSYNAGSSLQGFIRNSNGDIVPGNEGNPIIETHSYSHLPDNFPRDIDPKLINSEIPFPFPPTLTPPPPAVRVPNPRPGWRRNNLRQPRPGNYQRIPQGVRRVRPIVNPVTSRTRPAYYQHQAFQEYGPNAYEPYFTQKQGIQTEENPSEPQNSADVEEQSAIAENPVSVNLPDHSLLHQFSANGEINIPEGFTLPPGFSIPDDPQGIKISGIDVQGRRPVPGRYLEDMMHYYNKHERPKQLNTSPNINGSQYSERVGLSDQSSISQTRKPWQGNPEGQSEHTDEVFEHFWNIYNTEPKPPAEHDDRGPVPEESMGWGHTRNAQMLPNPNIRGLRPDGQGYPIRIRPDAENPDRILAVEPNRPHPLHHIKHPSQVPSQHRPFLGPLADIYQYSQKLASTLLNFPSNLFTQVADSRAEHMKNEVELLEGYNKVFQENNITSADFLPDMFNTRPDRNERLMILDTEKIRALNPFELSLITWTFLDFWEFLIEKVGTLSKDDLRQLEIRLEKLRKDKDHRMAKTLVDVTIDHVSKEGSQSEDDIAQIVTMTEEFMETLPEVTYNETSIDHSTESAVQGRMWDPLGIFTDEQRMQFMQFAIKVVFRFGRVYLNKRYALDCMMLLFCKDLNSDSKKEGMDGMAAKVKSVGLKVLTDKEERQMDTMSKVWRSLTAWESLQCEEMFPKCDGPKALEIVNEVAIGARK
ncbi:LOW QUALITY PROTEIN: uncharacterized protein [Palaemon carinicauda]|uniref:LOW QUALITY PROTEIN: uncharacterized protein n=1 Tax=Palaemon carinicauda TaxID=392227 RepID=UPI0035B66384